MKKRLLAAFIGGVLLLAHTAPAQIVAPLALLPDELGPPLVTSATLSRKATTVGQLQQVLTQDFTAGAWVDQSRSLYQRYRLPTSPGWVVNQSLNGSTWSNQSRVRYQYRPTGDILADTVDLYSTSPPGPYSAQVWTYDAQGRQQHMWAQSRNATANRWDSTSRIQYSYVGALRTRDLTETYAARHFSNQSQTLYTYNAASLLYTYETQTWAATASRWNPNSRTTYSYNAQGRVQQMVFESVPPQASTLTNFFRYTYQHNAQNLISTIIGEIWQNGTWQPYLQQLYTYDADGNPAIVTLQNWVAGAYQNTSRFLYTYVQVNGTAAPQGLNAGLTLAPNPAASGATTLRYRLSTAAPVTIQVLDALGRVAFSRPVSFQAAGAHVQELPTTELASGLYIVRLSAGSQSQAVKLLVE